MFPVSLPERSAWFAKLKTRSGRVRDGGSDGVVANVSKIPPLCLHEVGQNHREYPVVSALGLGVALGGAFKSEVGSHCEQERWTGAHAKVHWRVAKGRAECPGALEV